MTGTLAHRTLTLATIGALAAVAAAARSSSQSDPYSKLIGTWAVDSMNGADDYGVPKSQTIAFSRSGTVIHVTLTIDDGTGPTSLVVNCSAATGGAARNLGGGQSARCSLHPLADSIMYTLEVRKDSQIIASERGRLVVSNAGTTLRDDYDATRGAKVVATPSGAALRDNPFGAVGAAQLGHYRHVYRKQS
jgi:hypothetical protein